ncbi:solute carrier family 35 member F5 isoform X3 [Eucalyptus grandis]|uniref:solute carrier family 35 member F5 isoform X3 n=1 Tax=Eucalyptus grandis TaxID=71139 RepID=UPI00192EF4C5|nr:solute carrier family 35 member F5 isoform X3 [Eucalyptus grandis]
MTSKARRWILGLIYIVAVATIWIGASFLVQSVVHLGASPFLITYICNSLFIIYIPIFEIGCYVEDKYGSLWFWKNRKSDNSSSLKGLGELEMANLLAEVDLSAKADDLVPSTSVEEGDISQDAGSEYESESALHDRGVMSEDADKEVDTKGRWTRMRVAKSNTILSTSSSLFTFLVSLAFLGEKFTWIKLIGVLLCMGGTIIVSVGDSESASPRSDAALLGDILALVSAALYAVYITLIRKKLPDDDENQGQASMVQFLGYLGLFNLLIFLPVALVLNFAKLEPFTNLNWKETGLIVGKGLLDNVLSDYLWAKAVLLTSTTVATAGLSIQVPLAAVVESLTGKAPHLMDYLGAVAVMIGFAGIILPSDAFSRSKEASVDLGNEDIDDHDHAALRADC